MRILLVNTTDTGGAGRACVRLHLGLLEGGIESKLLLLHKTREDIPESYAITRNKNMLQRFRFKIDRKLKSMALKWKLKNKPKENYGFYSIEEKRMDDDLFEWADIVNLHWVAHFLDWESFFKMKKKVVWTLHDMAPFTGGCFHAQSCTQFKQSCNRCPQLSPSTATLSYKQLKIKQNLDLSKLHVVSPSKWLMTRSQQSALFQHAPHSLIPNSISSGTFSQIDKIEARKALNLQTEGKIISFVSHNIENSLKGLSFLVESFKVLKRNDIRLLIAGKGKIQGKNILHLGYIQDNVTLNRLYAASDLFVTPSLIENLPNVIMEALACGTPVVGFRVGGISEMITNGTNGFLCDGINSESLTASIRKALITNFNRSQICEESILKYGQKAQMQEYVKLFRALHYGGSNLA